MVSYGCLTLSLEWTRRKGYVRVVDDLSRTLGDYPYTPPSAPYSYLIFKKAGIVYARNGKTGELEFSDEDAAKVIQAAIDALTNGGKIFIKAGTYQITSDIKLSSNMICQGAGKENTKFVLAAKVDITFSNATNVLLSDFTYDAKTNGGWPIVGANCSYITLERLRILGKTGDPTVFAVYFAGPEGAVDGNVAAENLDKYNRIIDCDIIQETPDDTLSFSYQQYGEIRGNRIYGRVALYKLRETIFDSIVYGSDADGGVYVTGTALNLIIRGIIRKGTGTGFIARGTATELVKGLSVDIECLENGARGADLHMSKNQ